MSNKSNESKILFKNRDGIKITNSAEYWIYIVTENQYETLLDNFDKDNKYISAYSRKHISCGDIVLIYAKKKRDTNGFVGIVQVSNDMRKNTDNVLIYRDKNLNKYIIEAGAISIYDKPCQISELNEMIEKNSRSSLTSFCVKYLKGECTFRKIPTKKMGLALVKKIYQLNDRKNDEIVEEQNDNNSDKNEFQNGKPKSAKKLKRAELLNNSDKNKIKMGILVNNIPILLLTCDKLKESLCSLEKKNDKVDIIMRHYKYCDGCDITNNNSRELHMTLGDNEKIKIKYTEYDHESALLAYLGLECYPEDVHIDYIKIYNMINDDDYSGDILIEFTSRKKNI